MTDENRLRQEIRQPLEAARVRVGAFTGLYSDEDLAQDVLRTCDQVLALVEPSPRLEELRGLVEARCKRLAEVTSRFSARDPAVIAAARVQALAAINQLQDAVFDFGKRATPQEPLGLLRRRSL